MISSNYSAIATLVMRQVFGAIEWTISKDDIGRYNESDVTVFLKGELFVFRVYSNAQTHWTRNLKRWGEQLSNPHNLSLLTVNVGYKHYRRHLPRLAGIFVHESIDWQTTPSASLRIPSDRRISQQDCCSRPRLVDCPREGRLLLNMTSVRPLSASPGVSSWYVEVEC